MAKTKKEKKELLNKYIQKIKESKGFVLIKPSKLTPNEANAFRKEVSDFNAELNTVKNSVFKIALKESNLPEISELSHGEHSVLFFKEDMVNPNKALKKFAEATLPKDGIAKITVVSGILDNILLSKEQVMELADMTTIQGSISMILGILDNAMSSIVNVIEDPIRSYQSILDQAFKQ